MKVYIKIIIGFFTLFVIKLIVNQVFEKIKDNRDKFGM